MRPILALNCLLQIEQERSEEESSVGDALALAFRCAHFCSALLILSQSSKRIKITHCLNNGLKNSRRDLYTREANFLLMEGFPSENTKAF